LNCIQDGDGYEDFAVGSPYEDKGRGCVRIYLGRQNILKIQGNYTIQSKGKE
jgi:hypothetical protein